MFLINTKTTFNVRQLVFLINTKATFLFGVKTLEIRYFFIIIIVFYMINMDNEVKIQKKKKNCKEKNVAEQLDV